MFMPDAGPAAIAVSLNDNLHLCWDAGTCQFRYAWSGGYIDLWPVVRGNGNGLVNLKGEKFTYIKQGKPFGDSSVVKFEGYKRKDGLPIFMYTVDNIEIEVSFKANSSKAVDVIFNTTSTKALTYSPALTQGKWSANKGKIEGGSLILTPEESKNFTVTFSAGNQ